MRTLLKRLVARDQQPDVVTEMHAFNQEIRQLRRDFETWAAHQATEQALAQCLTRLEQITAILIASQEQAKALELWQQSTQDSHR